MALKESHRRARKKEVEGDGISVAEWNQVIDVFNGACAYCLRNDVPMTMDHVEPIATKGTHTAENIVPACARCNSIKQDRRLWSMLNR